MKTLARSWLSPVLLISFGTFAIHLLCNLLGGYGYFRDEFYYIACTDHLDWGYVDHPPLSIFLLWFSRALLGDSIFALRFLPAVASTLVVWITGKIVREFDGGPLAETLACLSVAVAPVYRLVGTFYSMNVFEPVFWMWAALILIRILRTGEQRSWVHFGIVSGLGLLNKHGMLFFGFALVCGLLVSAERRQLASRWFWIGGAIAAALFSVNIVWIVRHDFATWEFMRNAQSFKNMPMSISGFLSAQILFQHPATLPLWVGGVLAFFLYPPLSRYRVFGAAYLALLILFIAQNGKPYYLSPIYPVILAGGAVVFESWINRKNWRWLSRTYVTVILIGGLVLMPAMMPLLPVDSLIRYAQTIGMQTPRMERNAEPALPQVLADRFGWEEMVSDVAVVYNTLSPSEKADVTIVTRNYGEAGAVDFFGARYGLPKAISGHNNYWLWGPGSRSGQVLIVVGGRMENHKRAYDSVEVVRIHTNPYAMPFENNLPIYVLRRAKLPLADLWKSEKDYI